MNVLKDQIIFFAYGLSRLTIADEDTITEVTKDEKSYLNLLESLTDQILDVNLVKEETEKTCFEGS